MPRRVSSTPPDLAAETARVLAELSRDGASRIASLKLHKALRPKVLDAVTAAGFETTASWIRRPLTEQLSQRLAGGSALALRSLHTHLRGASRPEARKAAEQLRELGKAHLVWRGREEYLVASSIEVLTRSELGPLRRQLEALLTSIRKSDQANAKHKILRDDVTRDLERMLGGFLQAATEPSTETHDALLELTRNALEAETSLAFVPTVVLALISAGDSVEAAKERVLAAARHHKIELRPESGLGRLSSEQLSLCPDGPNHTKLSWMRLLEATE